MSDLSNFEFKNSIDMVQRSIMLFVGEAMNHNQLLVLIDMCLLVAIEKH